MQEVRQTQSGERPRVQLEQPIAIRFNHFSEFIHERLTNISIGGMLIRTRDSHPVASVFEFELRLGDDQHLILGKAQVVWLRSHGKGAQARSDIGARFVELDDANRAALQRLIDDNAPPDAPGPEQEQEEVPSEDALRAALIEDHLKTLRLPAVAREYATLAHQARDAGWHYEDYLRELLEAEVISRRERSAARRLREARFPGNKTLEQIDWEALQGVSRARIDRLASCDYIARAEDVVLVGPVGTGKTHLAIALGIEATQRRYRVLFRRSADLARELIEARDDRELGRLQTRLQRVDLLICDEVGPTPFSKTGGELLFHLLADRSERRSTMVTTSVAFGEWQSIFGAEELAAALVDRLGRRGHLLTLESPSYRGQAGPRGTA